MLPQAFSGEPVVLPTPTPAYSGLSLLMVRKKLKGLLRRIPLLRRFVPAGSCEKSAQNVDVPATPVAHPPAAPGPVAPAPVAPPPVAPPLVEPELKTAPESVQEAMEAGPAAAKSPIDEEKIRKHREKTKKGVLKHLSQKGGSTSLAELHDYSEKRFFVAHRAFSSLMEEVVDEGLILWDATSGIATLTDAGRALLKG